MTSERSPEPDPRRKRAFLLGGALVIAAIAWNASDDDDVHITIADDSDNMHEARDAIRSSIREEIRAGFRGDEDEDATEDATGDEEADADTDEEASDEDDAATEAEDEGERRLVETESGENQRSFRIEGDDGRGVTISLDPEPAE